MKPAVKVGIAAVLVFVGGLWAYSAHRRSVTEYEHQLDLDRIRKEFLQREPFAQLMADPAKYEEEQRAIFKWYVGELTEHYKHYPAFKNYQRFMDDLLARRKAKRVGVKDFAGYEERYQIIHPLWEMIRTGKYDPIFSGVDQGLRLDIYEVETMTAKEPKIRFKFVLWGPQRRWSTDSSSGGRVTRLFVNASFPSTGFKFTHEDQKTVNEIRATGDPFKIDNPERFVDEFPPGAVVGYYEIPKVPAPVASAEMTFEITTRSVVSGEEATAKTVWKTPVPTEWKLSPGMSWEGAREELVEAADEEEKPVKKKAGQPR
jgi:hypothetical protein